MTVISKANYMEKDYETDSVKYLGIQIDKSLTWKHQIINVAVEREKADAMLSKLTRGLHKNTLKSVYYATFESHLRYASLVWA